MRTREEIECSIIGTSGSVVFNTPKEQLILEVLLDIRDIINSKK